MSIKDISTLIVLLLFLLTKVSVHADDKIGYLEEFKNLDAWEPLLFPSIKRHSEYEILSNGRTNVLVARSDDSASAILSKQSFNITQYPIIRWRWKVDNVYKKGNYRLKDGDDYPIRIYVFFEYDPKMATTGMKIKYGLAKKLYGQYPPYNCLNYIWANRPDETEMVPNPFTKRSIMIPLEKGSQKIGQWVEESVNVLEDYRKAFGDDPPPNASLAIMNDSDNTGESSTSYLDFIEVRKE